MGEEGGGEGEVEKVGVGGGEGEVEREGEDGGEGVVERVGEGGGEFSRMVGRRTGGLIL